jgi:hypothetical protein
MMRYQQIGIFLVVIYVIVTNITVKMNWIDYATVDEMDLSPDGTAHRRVT